MRLALAALLLVTLIPAGSALAKIWHINPFGTGDAPTIQAGMDSAAAGDTVLLATGTYYEHDIQVRSGIIFKYQTSLTENCIIDAQGQGRVLIFDGVDATTELDYMTFRGGHAAGTGSDGSGGALYFTNYSAPTLYLCDCFDNVADAYGGAVYCEDHSSPHYVWGTLRGNQAGAGGGGLACASDASPNLNSLLLSGNTTPGNGGGVHCAGNAAPSLWNCVIFNCKAGGFGGGMYTEGGSVPAMEVCILAFNMDGEGFYAADDQSVPTFNCCDIYGNEGGDWVGRIADQDTTLGNISVDPLFCDTTVVLSDYGMWVEECSPCLIENHPSGPYTCGQRMGYIYEYCGCGEATAPTTWGTIKSRYR